MKKNNQIALFILIAIFALPFLVSSFILRENYQPVQTTNHGEFLSAEQNIQDLNLAEFKVGDAPRWRLLSFINEPVCYEDCQSSLHQTAQLLKALGKRKSRIDHIVAIPDTGFVSKDYPAWEALAPSENTPGDIAKGIYVVDPFGSLILHYPLQGAHQGLFKDIKKLLKLSKI